MISKMIVATDGSSHASRAAEKALFLAKQIDGCEAIILYVNPNAPTRSQIIQSNFDVQAILAEEAKQAIVKTEDSFKSEGIPYKVVLKLGDPALEIVKCAEKNQADLIVVGSRGLGKIGEIFLSSVSNRVAHKANCPVLIVK